MKAIHGGKAKKDKIDSRKIAGLMRGGMFPLAYRQYDMERPDPFDSYAQSRWDPDWRLTRGDFRRQI